MKLEGNLNVPQQRRGYIEADYAGDKNSPKKYYMSNNFTYQNSHHISLENSENRYTIGDRS